MTHVKIFFPLLALLLSMIFGGDSKTFFVRLYRDGNDVPRSMEYIDGRLFISFVGVGLNSTCWIFSLDSGTGDTSSWGVDSVDNLYIAKTGDDIVSLGYGEHPNYGSYFQRWSADGHQLYMKRDNRNIWPYGFSAISANTFVALESEDYGQKINLVFYDSLGTILHENAYSDQVSIEPCGITIDTGEGAIYFCGYTLTGPWYAEIAHCLVAKFSRTGDKLWAYRDSILGESSYSKGSSSNPVAYNPIDQCVYVSGYVRQPPGGMYIETLWKIDAGTGRCIWKKMDLFSPLRVSAIYPLSDGNLATAGWRQTDSSFFISKLDTAGHELWLKSYTLGKLRSDAYSMLELPDHRIAITGNTSDTLIYNIEQGDVFVIVADSQGTVVTSTLQPHEYVPQSADLQCYPNPCILSATQRLTFRYQAYGSGATIISIYDVKGRHALTRKLSHVSPGWRTETVDLSNFEHGVYFIRIDGSGTVRTGKVLVLP